LKIGFFDSGLGGLLITQAVIKKMPQYDYIYLGDTLHVPYGKRSKEAILNYSKASIDYLFSTHNCQIIITACNTVSASVLRTLQQEYLPKHYPERRILGVVVPTLESAMDGGYSEIGVIATESTISSNIYKDELEKVSKDITIHQQSAPLLVPLIEHNGVEWAEPILKNYLKPLMNENIEALILGCTHYPRMKRDIQNIIGSDITLISQDEIIPDKLSDYLERHPESEQLLTRSGTRKYLVTDLTDSYQLTARSLCHEDIHLEKIVL
jgi:glutamate racemase